MNQREHFGMIGLQIGESIKFRDCEDVFIVSSGNGTPDNGGTLVRRQKSRKKNRFYSLRCMTRQMLGGKELPEQIDIWSYWVYNDITLREMLDKNDGKPGYLHSGSTCDNVSDIKRVPYNGLSYHQITSEGT